MEKYGDCENVETLWDHLGRHGGTVTDIPLIAIINHDRDIVYVQVTEPTAVLRS